MTNEDNIISKAPENIRWWNVGQYLTELDMAADLCVMHSLEFVIVDMSKTIFVEPFAGLYLAIGIRQLRKRYKGECKFTLRLSKSSDIASFGRHNALFRAMGYPIGEKLNSTPKNLSTIPYGYLNIERLNKDAEYYLDPPGQYVEEKSIEIVDALIGLGLNESYRGSFIYIFREVLRNSVEHSESKRVWFCLQYFPRTEKVEIGILDEGVGLKETLSRVPRFKEFAKTEYDAVELATAPYVTRTIDFKKHGKPFENTGFGLYAAKRIAKRAGDLVLISNGYARRYKPLKDTKMQVGDIEGAAARLRLNLADISKWKDMTADILKQADKDVLEYSHIEGLDQGEPSAKSMSMKF